MVVSCISDLFVDLVFPVVERILLVAWLLKDCGWLILNVYMAIPFGCVSVTIHFLLLLIDPRPSFRFYNWSLFFWVFGNFIWMSIEFVYSEPSTDVHIGPQIPLGGLPASYQDGMTKAKSWLFFMGILIQLAMYMGIYFRKVDMARDVDEDPVSRTELQYLLGMRREVRLRSESVVSGNGSVCGHGCGHDGEHEHELVPTFSPPQHLLHHIEDHDHVDGGGISRLRSTSDSASSTCSHFVNQSQININTYNLEGQLHVPEAHYNVSLPISHSTANGSINILGTSPQSQQPAGDIRSYSDNHQQHGEDHVGTNSQQQQQQQQLGMSLVFVENIYIVFWIMKDFFWSWGTGDFTRGLASAIFYESIALFFGMVAFCLYLVTAYIYRNDYIRLADSITTMFWIAANFVWMSGEFFIRYRNLELDDTDQGRDESTRIVAVSLFAVGILIQFFVLLHVGLKSVCKPRAYRRRRASSAAVSLVPAAVRKHGGVAMIQLYDIGFPSAMSGTVSPLPTAGQRRSSSISSGSDGDGASRVFTHNVLVTRPVVVHDPMVTDDGYVDQDEYRGTKLPFQFAPPTPFNNTRVLDITQREPTSLKTISDDLVEHQL